MREDERFDDGGGGGGMERASARDRARARAGQQNRRLLAALPDMATVASANAE